MEMSTNSGQQSLSNRTERNYEMAKKKTGTREWAEKNINVITGCEHRCRYCYAAEMAKRYHRIAALDEWGTPQLRPKEVAKKRRKVKGRIMFPTTHDITPRFLEDCVPNSVCLRP